MNGQRRRDFPPTPLLKTGGPHTLGFGKALLQVRNQFLPPIKVPSNCLYLPLNNQILPQFSNRTTKPGKCYLRCGAHYTAISGKSQRSQDQTLIFRDFCWTCRGSMCFILSACSNFTCSQNRCRCLSGGNSVCKKKYVISCLQIVKMYFITLASRWSH